jgi:predicted pyridoxine 5'-phosphate oxidase superfamily flavin-nucleotide-binding protein
MPVPSAWHPGEIAAQQARGYEDAAWGGFMGYEEGAPSFMAAFLSNLPFLSVTTLDKDGLPWASLICNDGRTGFMQLEREYPTSRFKCSIEAPKGVPIRECLLRLQRELLDGREPYDKDGDARPEFQMAGVGVMLHNRRRNKMEGVIVSVQEAPVNETDTRFVFELDVSTTFGNCPKCE